MNIPSISHDQRKQNELDRFLDLIQEVSAKNRTLRIGQSSIILSLLSACGGGGSSNNAISSNDGSLYGRVIDGYISGARVFRDANNDLIQNNNEFATTTDNLGRYILSGNSDQQIIANSNNGTAIDVQTGLPFLATLIAPSDYKVVTPVTTLVSSLTMNGVSQDEAEAMVLNVLGLNSGIQLQNYDPYNQSDNASSEYKVAAIKIANILMASDGDLSVDASSGLQVTLNEFANLLQENASLGRTIDLSDASVISEILPNASLKLQAEISAANSVDNFSDVLDEQLLLLAGNVSDGISVTAINGERLIAIEISGEFNASDEFKATLLNTSNGRSTESADLVSFGSNVAVFRFSNWELQKLGSGSLELQVTNTTTSETFVSGDVIGITPSGGIDGIIPGEPEEIITDSGVVADGYISGARVFRDANENGVYDPGEVYVETDGSGAFTGLGGDPTKPIVADGGDEGDAIDTSTGIIFNSTLSAPAGSKVVNPITTIVNELMVSDGLSLDAANTSVATGLGLTDITDAGVDFTKFDPISNTLYDEDGEIVYDIDGTSPKIAADLATTAQGAATYIANIIVSAANEKGGDPEDIVATTKTLIGNLKTVIKSKSDAIDTGTPGAAPFSYGNADDILEVLGDDFNASSPTLEKLQEQFSTFTPDADDWDPNTNFNSDKLIEKQLLSQSEFGDGILTTTEAANGAVLVLGPTFKLGVPATKEAYDEIATIQITNSNGTIWDEYLNVTFDGSKYTSVELTKEQLDAIGGGSFTVDVKIGELDASTWGDALDADTLIYTKDLYYHENITPVVSFSNDTVVVGISNGEALITSLNEDGNFLLSGNIEIDLGNSTLPDYADADDIILKNLVEDPPGNADGDGRSVTLEFINKSTNKVEFALQAQVDPESSSDVDNNGSKDGQNDIGSATFTWSKSFTNDTLTLFGIENSAGNTAAFSDLEDGNYEIKATFSDIYGASSSSTIDVLSIDRTPPEIEVTLVDSVVNIDDADVVFKVSLSKPVTTVDEELISLKISPLQSIDANGDPIYGTPVTNTIAEIATASAVLSDSKDELTITYTPSGEGKVELVTDNEAFIDSSGNKYTTGSDDPITASVSAVYDLTSPSIPLEAVDDPEIILSTGSSTTTSINSDGAYVAAITFSENVTGLTIDDFTVSSIGGVSAATLNSLDSTDNKTWTFNVVPTANLNGNFTISLGNESYTDTKFNAGPGAVTANLDLDTTPAAAFQVLLDEEKAEYSQGQNIIIQVVYDENLKALSDYDFDTTPVINLGIGESTRSAELVSITDNVAEFQYTVTNADLSDENGIVVGDTIVGPSLYGKDGNEIETDIGSVDDPLNLSGKSVDGGTSGSAVDGYVEGAVIYADNDDDNVGLTVAEVSSSALVDVTTSTSYTAYSLTDTEHGVSSSGKFVLTGNDDDGWSAYAVTGDGPLKVLLNEAGNTITILINDPNVTTQEDAEDKIFVNSLSITDMLDIASGWEATGDFEEAVAGDDGTPAKYILSTARSFTTSTTIGLDENGDGSSESEFRTFPVVGNSDTISPFELSIAADTGTLSINQSIIDELTPISVSVERTETVYALTDEDHGVSQSGNFVLRGNEVDGFVAYEVTGTSAPYETSATADTGTLLITSQTDIDGGAGLSEGDSIAQADATGGFVIYGADGPLVLEGGFDISTNKEFTVRYKAPADYTVINPVSTLVVAGTTSETTSDASAVNLFNEIYSQYEGAAASITTSLTASDFKSYNAYDRIAQAADVAIDSEGSSLDVNSVVADALIYQKAAASYALVVDFISNASFGALYALGAEGDNTVAKISDEVFAAISGNLADFTRTFANINFEPLYGGDNADEISNIANELKATLDDVSGVEELKASLFDAYDLNFVAYTITITELADLNIESLSSAGTGTYGLEINSDGSGRLVKAIADAEGSSNYVEDTGEGAVFVDLSDEQVAYVTGLNSVGTYTIESLSSAGAGTYGLEINSDGSGRLVRAIADAEGSSNYVEDTGEGAVFVDLSDEQVAYVTGLNSVGTYTTDRIYELLANSVIAINTANTDYPDLFDVFDIDTTLVDLELNGTYAFEEYVDGSGRLILVEPNADDDTNGTFSYVEVTGDTSSKISLTAEQVTVLDPLSLVKLGDASMVSEDEIISASEAGINALTEIVQVQAVVQANVLGDVLSFLDSSPTSGFSSGLDDETLLGSDEQDGYLVEPVGTVVPIRYEVAFDGNADAQIAFEGDADGIAASFDFVVTRSGSIKTTSTLNYSIEGGVNSADISGGELAGEIFFDVNEKQKIISVTLNNDDVREASETLTVVISDPTDTSMIVQDRASVTIKDDDPSNPEVSISQSNYSLSQGTTSFLDPISVDYFDANSYFKLEWNDTGGTLTSSNGDTEYTGDTFLSNYDMQTSVLRNLEFTAQSDDTAVSDANVIFTLTAAENADGTGRTSSTEFELNFDVELLPTVDIDIQVHNEAVAGVATEISGITVADKDSDYLTVNVEADLDGELYSVSTADYSSSVTGTNSISISGEINAVQDALDNLRFKADAAGDLKLSFSVDDNSALHLRNANGDIADARSYAEMVDDDAISIAASPPEITQVFEPFIKAGLSSWNGFSGIEVSDLDSDSLTVLVSATTDNSVKIYYLTETDHNVESDGLYAYDTLNDKPYVVSGAGTADNPYTRSATPAESADGEAFTIAGNLPLDEDVVGTIDLKVNFRLADAPAGLEIPSLPVPATEVTISGTPNYVNQVLSLLQVSISDEETDLITVKVNDNENSEVSMIPTYVPASNAAPNAGGNLTGSSIDESDFENYENPQDVQIDGIYLFDIDAFDISAQQKVIPDTIRIVSVEGGKAFFNGLEVFDEDGVSRDIPLSEINNTDVEGEAYGSVKISFAPDKDFTGDAKISYVVVDPIEDISTGPVSDITIAVRNINDAPSIKLSPVPTVYDQGQNPISVLTNVKVNDIDSQLFSKVVITTNLDAEEGDMIVAPDSILGMSKASESDINTIIYNLAEGTVGGITSTNVASLLSNIKFSTSSKNLVGDTRQDPQTREITVKVTDDLGDESVGVTKTIILNDVNDAPFFIINDQNDQSLTGNFKEGDQPGVAISSFGEIDDLEGDNVSSVTIKFKSGYKLGQDKISLSDINSFSNEVTTEFDEATGSFKIEAISASGLTPSDFNAILSLVYYSNSSDNPQNGARKELVLELTDNFGKSGVSEVRTITLEANNDNPEVYSVVAGLEKNSSSGAQFVSPASGEDPTPIRIAPNVAVRDLDGNEFSYATIEVTSPDGVATLSTGGQQLKTAFNLTTEVIEKTATSGQGIKIYKGLEDDDNYIGRSNLEAILKEIVYYNTSGSEFAEAATDTVKFVVVDKFGAPSNEKDGEDISAFTSTISLLNAPAIEVKSRAITDDASDPLSYALDVDSGFANVLNVNSKTNGEPLIFSNQLTVDLSTATIRSDGARYIYDASQTTDKLALSKARHIDISNLGGSEDTTTTILGLEGANVIYGSSYSDFIDGKGGKDVIYAGSGDDTVVLRAWGDETSGVAKFDGGSGVDTLVVPNTVSGILDLSDLNVQNVHTEITNFENLDASSATSSVIIEGTLVDNVFLGGTSSDEITLGAGDVEGDTARGGAGADTFVIDLETASSGAILDLTNVDKIKLRDSGEYVDLVDVNWLHKASFEGSSGDKPYSVSVDLGDNGYNLNIVDEIADTTTIISLGTSIYGSLGKWLQTGLDDFVLKPTKNIAPVFVERGPTTGPNSGIKLGSDIVEVEVGDEAAVASLTDGLTSQVYYDVTSDKILAETENDPNVFVFETPTEVNGTAIRDAYAIVEKFDKSDVSLGYFAIKLKPNFEDGYNAAKFSYVLSGAADTISVSDSDNDNIHLSVTADGVDVTIGGLTPSENGEIGTYSEINDLLNTLTVYGDSRGNGNVTVSITDGFAPSITKTIFFETPNSLPDITVLDDEATFTDTINSNISFAKAGVDITITDPDDLDLTDRTISVTMDVRGGVASYIQDPSDDEQNYFPQFVNISGGKIIISHDGETALPDGFTWPQILEEIASDITVSRSTVGSVEVDISVEDNVGGPEAQTIIFDFTPESIRKPELITDAAASENGDINLNGAQFETVKARVFVKDIGASVGDTIELVITIKEIDDEGDLVVVDTLTATKSISASASDATAVTPYIDFNLSNIVSSDLRNGTFEISSNLYLGSKENNEAPASTTSVDDLVTFTVDTSAPDTPEITSILANNKSVELLTNEDVTTVKVTAEAGLSFELVAIHRGKWYDLNPSLDLDTVLITEPTIPAINPDYDEVSGEYTLTFSDVGLESAVYALIAKDSVGNISGLDLSGFVYSNYNFPDGIFIIDKNLSEDDVSYNFTSDNWNPSPSGREYNFGVDEASNVEIEFSELPKDISKIKLEVWSDANNTGSSNEFPNIYAEFERDPNALESIWGKIETVPIYSLGFTVGADNTSAPLDPGNYLISDLGGGSFAAHLVSGDGVDTNYTVSETAITIKSEDLNSEIWSLDLNTSLVPLTRAVLESALGEEVDFYSFGGSGEYSSINDGSIKDGEYLSPMVILNLTDGLSGNAGYAGIRITFEDFSGNSVFLDTGSQEVKVDFIADEWDEEDETSINYDLVTSLVSENIKTGISKDEAENLQISLSGVDADVLHRSSFVISSEQFANSLFYASGVNAGSRVYPDDTEAPSIDVLKSHELDRDYAELNIGGDTFKVPSFDGGLIYSDIGQAFVTSLSNESNETPSSSAKDWKFIGTTEVIEGEETVLKSEYIQANFWSAYVNETMGRDELDIYLSDFVVNSHIDKQLSSRLNQFEQNISSILAEDGSEDDFIFIINQVFDSSGNTSFRNDILQNTGTSGTTLKDLRVDVRDATVLSGMSLGDQGDTGSSNSDLVTQATRPEITFSVDEKIASARIKQISRLDEQVSDVSELAVYDLSLDETPEDDGFTYVSALLGANINLTHGLWALEVTDVSGNVSVSDAGALFDDVLGQFNLNQSIPNLTNGVFVVDTISPPDATVSVEFVENMGGYINQYEVSNDLEIVIRPGEDNMSNAELEYQIADILSVSIIGGGETLSLDVQSSTDTDGTETFTFDANALSDGDYTIRVSTVDVAGNEKDTDYTFVKDISSPVDPVTSVTIDGINKIGVDKYSDDLVLNREEIGFGDVGNDLAININLADPESTGVVSVLVDEFDVWGLPFDIEMGGVNVFSLVENQFGTHLAGDYVIAEASDGEFIAYKVSTGSVAGYPYDISYEGISINGRPSDPTGFIRTGELTHYYGDGIAELSSINFLDIINPDSKHQELHTVTVVVSDMAGNLQTHTLDFGIDTRLAGEPDLVVERAISSTPALDLDYWETIGTYHNEPGIRFQITGEFVEGYGDRDDHFDQVVENTVMVNGELATVIDKDQGIYFIERDVLNDSIDGLKAKSFVPYEVDGIVTQRPVFELNNIDHGVAAQGDYILVENSSNGWDAFSVTGEGPDFIFTKDENELDASQLLSGTNTIEFEMVDEFGNTNTFTQFFTSDLDPTSGQYFSVVPTLYTTNSGSNTFISLDVYASEIAMDKAREASNYEGSASFDLIIDLPDTIFTSQMSEDNFTVHEAFDGYARINHDLSTDEVLFSAFSNEGLLEGSDLLLTADDPILTIDLQVQDPLILKDLSEIVSLNVAKISEVPVFAEDDALSLQYAINLDDLIITPADLSF